MVISAPCPKFSAFSSRSSRNRSLNQQQVASISSLKPSFPAGSARISRLQGSKQTHAPILKAQAHEASAEGSSESAPLSATPSEDSKDVESNAHQSVLSESSISAFMAEASDLVKLVDSKDIMELKLKQKDIELIIRKKEAFVQAPPTAPVVMMQHPQQSMLPSQPSVAQPTPAATPSRGPAAAPSSPPKGSKSSLPPLTCPMAGTFYRCPAPGEPPFVKVGDKVQKGQVVCIIEAMKLMNEIEADQSGTVVEILAEDGEPVSVDMPLLVIQP
ncbi:uncharacterized protein A4U43_C07F29180 [Asparagus officinalis]|uniref:Biotin carboxyl carrier protein of acetyl-CoA carboxylase n=1 Tax=Asparagus officinalis TaxID=4686 RepID=A0A5P1EJE7_ASPOF|nr:biotin carboxyl carrier protein of acetyl-CoA carboxylase 1, chloroplastic-like [Asparagus officinalis]ONK64721.1 uncharacterized protein A4U43_C07F29180 [Asparagus officinalis]